MKISLDGHHALVCGGSQGIGAAIGLALAQAGARVTLVARNEANLNDMLARLPGSGHRIFIADFNVDADIDRLLVQIDSEKPDILVNNTGGPKPGPVSLAKPESFEQAFRMHLLVSHKLSIACLPHMKKYGFGRIINIISTSVKIPIDGLGVSNTTRGAMASWAKTLSNEIAQYGITVNNILPGLTQTDRLNGLVSKIATEKNMSFEQTQKELLSSIPAGRFGLPEEMANYATFLSSDFAAYITGTSLCVDGGKTGTI